MKRDIIMAGKLILCLFYGLSPVLAVASQSPPSVWDEDRADLYEKGPVYGCALETLNAGSLNPILWGTAVLCDHGGHQPYANALHEHGWQEIYLIDPAQLEERHAPAAVITHNDFCDIIMTFRGLEGFGEQMAYLPQVDYSWVGYLPSFSIHETTTAPLLGLSDGWVQKGLYTYFQTHIHEKLKETLNAFAHKRDVDRGQLRLIFSGFGAGGAFAQMAALDALNLDIDYIKNSNNRINVITFASQSVFDEKAATVFDRLIGIDNHVAFTMTQDASSWKTANFTSTGRSIALDPSLYIEQKSNKFFADPKKMGIVLAAGAGTAYSGGVLGAGAAAVSFAVRGYTQWMYMSPMGGWHLKNINKQRTF